MATIPQITTRRSLDIGSAPQYSGADPIGAAVEKIGNQGNADLRRYQERVEQQKNFEALLDLNLFTTNEQTALEEVKRNMPPGGTGITKQYLEGRDQRERAFLDRIDPAQRREFELRIRNNRAQFERIAATTEFTENQRFAVDAIDKRIEAGRQGILSGGPAQMEPFVRDVEELIDASTLPMSERLAQKQRARAELARVSYQNLPLEERRRVAASEWGIGGKNAVDSVVDRIVGVESDGNDYAKNPNSSATGAGQFIKSTWLTMVRKYRPEVAQGKTDAEVLALRNDGALSRLMTKHYAEENANYLQSRGIDTTPGNVYLAHFLGPGRAAAVLSVDPSTPVSEIVGDDAVNANRSILGGRTAGEVAAWASRKMSGAPAMATGPYSSIPYAERIKLAAEAEKQEAQTTAASVQLSQQQQAQAADDFLKEAYQRAEKGTLTADFVEGGRGNLSSAQYKNLLTSLREESATDDPQAVVDLTARIATDTPDQFHKAAAEYVQAGKLKTTTFVSLAEKNRAAAKDDQPNSPYRSGRDVVKTTLDPGQLLSGPAAAIGRSTQAQALIEFDNWAATKPQATRAEATAEAQEIIKRYQIVPYDQMKLAIGTSRYFGGKSRSEIAGADIDAAEQKLFTDIKSGTLSREQQEFEVRLLKNWREIVAREAAAKGATSGPRR